MLLAAIMEQLGHLVQKQMEEITKQMLLVQIAKVQMK